MRITERAESLQKDNFHYGRRYQSFGNTSAVQTQIILSIFIFFFKTGIIFTNVLKELFFQGGTAALHGNYSRRRSRRERLSFKEGGGGRVGSRSREYKAVIKLQKRSHYPGRTFFFHRCFKNKSLIIQLSAGANDSPGAI